MSTILKVQDLVTRFYTFDGVVHALNKVSFDLTEGETLAIVGESGSGKSVTMMSLLHLLPVPPAKIEGGQALFYENGNAIDLLQLSKAEISKVRGGKIGFIFQDALSALNPVMTVGQQVSESLIEHLQMGQEEARKRTIELLDYVGIPGASQRFSNYPHQFSGGMRQRVMIAVAIACNPKIVIADEPTTALACKKNSTYPLSGLPTTWALSPEWPTGYWYCMPGVRLKSPLWTSCTTTPAIPIPLDCWVPCPAWGRLFQNDW